MSVLHRWRLGIVSDAHLSPATAEPYTWQNTVDLPHSAELLDAALAWLRAQDIDALAFLGDLTESADPASFAAMRERVLGFGVPVLAVPGNCDVDPVDLALTSFASIAGDRVQSGPDRIDLGPGYSVELVHLGDDRAGLRGVRPPETTVPPGAIHVMLTHYPVLDLAPHLHIAGFRHSANLTNREEIEAELRAMGQPVVVIHGHLHIHDARISGPLLHLSCGALIEPPHHVSVVDIAPADAGITVSWRTHSVRDDAVERLPVFAASHLRWEWTDRSWRVLPSSLDYSSELAQRT
jgi:predicted phosphodiesterase